MKKLWIIIAALVIVALAIVLTLTQIKAKPEEIRIGAILPLTGSSAQYGLWIKEALELGREEVNSKGGINGKPLTITYEDDQADPKIATSAMQKLITVDKVPLVYGSWASSCVLSAAPIAEEPRRFLSAKQFHPKSEMPVIMFSEYNQMPDTTFINLSLSYTTI